MKRLSAIAVFLTLIFAVGVSTQAQMQAPKPGPELKKLGYFVGSWTLQGDEKPGPMGPGGKWSGSETLEWMKGGYFLVSHSTFKSASMGSGSGTAYMGYNVNDKMYTYDEFNTMGEAAHSKGTLDGDNWNWTSEEKMGGQMMKERFSMKILSPTSYTMKFEMSSDGNKWDTVMEGKATKAK
jgi:Protein of unknown function (DUF1579)